MNYQVILQLRYSCCYDDDIDLLQKNMINDFVLYMAREMTHSNSQQLCSQQLFKMNPLQFNNCTYHHCTRRVKNLTFMTTFWLRCFDDWFDFLEPFKKYLAPVSLAKIPAFFPRSVNSKWPPVPLWKNNFWHIKPTNMNKYTFLANSTTRNPFLTSIWYKNTFLTLKSKMADKFGRTSIFLSETEFDPHPGYECNS